MTRFAECLREHRKHAGLTQEQLAQKVEASDKSLSASYISKMETGLLPPPSRKAAMGLADALGMSNKPVTLYVSTKDKDALQRFVFFLTAYVAGAEDVQLIRLVQVEDGNAEDEKGNDAPMHSTANLSVERPDVLFGVRAEEIEHLIASGDYSEEEEKQVWAAVIEMIKRFNSFKETQRKIQKKG